MPQYIPAPIGESSPGVAPGGLKGQYLRKASDLDYDTDWEDVVVEGGAPSTRIDAATSGTVYIGLATSGSSESAAAWSITRCTYSFAGIRTSKLRATGVAWTNRTSVSYS